MTKHVDREQLRRELLEIAGYSKIGIHISWQSPHAEIRRELEDVLQKAKQELERLNG